VKAAPFDYAAPDCLAAALATLAHTQGRIIAGGQSLVAMMNQRLCSPAFLVDIARITDVPDLEFDTHQIKVGARARQRDVELHGRIRHEYPYLGAALRLIATPPIRHRGTVVGSLAHADPAAELPALAVCVDAELTLESAARGARTLKARAFYRGRHATAAAADEMVTAVAFPRLDPDLRFAIVETNRRYNGTAIAGAAVAVRLAHARIAHADIVLFGIADVPVLCAAGASLQGTAITDRQALAEVAAGATAGVDVVSDVLASASYRRHAAGVLVRRALEQALSISSTPST